MRILHISDTYNLHNNLQKFSPADIIVHNGISHSPPPPLPLKRWGAHVTSWNKAAGIKFRVDVAMMCKFGFDINLQELNPEERAFCQNAVAGYNRLKNDTLRYLYRTAKATGSGKKEYQNIFFRGNPEAPFAIVCPGGDFRMSGRCMKDFL